MPDPLEKTPRAERLWTRNFLLLWQGQLVSILGDVVYEIALGFWVLAVTGSTALMGTLLAASTLPRILVSPFAGVVIDRSDRRRLMILMDVARGVVVSAVGAAAIVGVLQIWMVFAAGVILGICGAFFSPAVGSVIPDITAPRKVVRANSVLSMLHTGGSIVGNSAGGFLFQLLGAPFLFLFNGVSYLFSGANLLFARFPAVHHAQEGMHFGKDLKSGFSFVWKIRGLRYLILIAAVINFFANMAFMLFLPFYQRNPALGPAKYGIAMALFTGGMFLGMSLTAAVKIPPARRFVLFQVCGIMSFVCMCAFPFMQSFPVAVTLLALSGLANAVLNVFINSVMQLAVPPGMRGKVFSLMGTVTQGLTPIAFALAGVLASFFPIPLLMSLCFGIVVPVGLPFMFLQSFKRFICFDPARDTVESVR
ncbi:MAG TPA: MFS transporter [Spirochaetia bacterium]|nr:MFS transporter [Spirochaetia bacterium]